MAKIDEIKAQIHKAQAEAVRNSSSLSAATPGSVVKESQKIVRQNIAAQQAAKQSSGGQAETSALPEVADTRTTKQKYNDAQKAYDDYLASPEYRQRQSENNQKALQEAMQRIFAAGASASDLPMGYAQVAPQADAQEQELKATVEHYRQQMEAEENQRILDADMNEIQSWSDEDRAALEEYVRGKDERDDPLTVSNPFRFLIQNKKVSDSYSALAEKYGEERLVELAESYGRVLHEQDAKKIVEDTTAAVDTVPGAVGHNLLSIGANTVGGVFGLLGRVNEHFNKTGRYATLEEYTPGDSLSLYGSTVRGATAENIEGEDGSTGRKVLSAGYQGVMSFADTVARSILGGKVGSLALAASGSFTQTMSEATKQGATPQQAVILATGSAGIEAATEFIPLDEMLKAAKGGAKGGMAIAKEALKQAGIEATTEEIGLFGNLLFEAAVLREKSSYKQKIGELVANGTSYEDAKKQADKDVWNEALQTAFVSGIAGGLSGGGAAYVGSLAADGATEETAEVTQETPTEAVPAAPAVNEEQQIMGAVAAELAKQAPQQESLPVTPEMEQLDAAVAATIGAQPDVDPTTTQEETAYHDEFEDWGKDPNREGVANPLSDRSYSEVGKRSVKAYMYENPAVKPFYQEQAAWLLSELADSTKGERTYNEQLHYESGGEQGWSGTKRHTSESIAELLDQDGMSYDQIERGLNAIVNDHGQENNAVSKRIEFVINDRLMNGYIDFYTGQKVPGNAEYLNLLRNQQSAPDVDTSEAAQMGASNGPQQSAEGVQGIKGTGAAEGNFSGKPAYNATLSEENSQADRRDDVRPMELPQRDINGGNISAVTGNVYGSRITPDDFASLMEEPTAKGDFTYAKITNDQATELAVDTISQCGDWDTAYSQWVREVDRGVAGAEMTARGALLLNHAAQEGNKAKWLDILSDMQRLGTNTAQGLQAFRIIRTLSAPDKIEFAKVTVRKMVQDLNLGVEINIDETLLNEYEQAQTDEERDAILLDIQQNVADQIPSTTLDKWTALRYMNMLGNLKTNVRNVMGNVGSSLVYRMKDQIATTMERIAGTERTKSHTVSRELLAVCKQDFEQFKDVVSSGGKYSDGLSSDDQFRQGVMDKRRIFKNPLLEGYRKGTNWMMNNGIFGDEAFGRAAYARALAGFLKANGVTAEQFQQMAAEKPKVAAGTPKTIIPEGTKVKAADRQNYGTIQKYNEADNTYLVHFVSPSGHTANVTLSADVLTPVGKRTDTLGPVPKPEQKMEFVDYARAYAIREAQEATFHDNSTLAEIVSKVQKSTGVVGQGIMPFTKTPANVLTRAIEFSPLGIINSTVKTIQSKRDVDITGADIVNSWSKTLTGTALFALGASMMDQGLLAGGPDEDDEQAVFDNMNGHQDYAITLPDGTNYTIDWLTPAAMPMFMGAQFWDIITREEDFSFADMEKVFTSIADPMIQMSMLQGLNDSLDSIKYSDNNLGQFFINAAVSYLTQGLTNTLLGQLEKSSEENRMTTFVDKDSSIPQWMQQQLGKMSQKIPGWDYQQAEYLNAWGETQKNEGDLTYDLLSPGYISTERSDPITKELNRLREATGKNVFPQTVEKSVNFTDTDGVTHSGYNLSQKEFETMQKVEGQTAHRLAAEVIINPDYVSLTDKQKAEVMGNIYAYAQEEARKQALPKYYSEAPAWMREIGEESADGLIRRATLSTINSSVTNTVDNIENGWEVTPAAKQDLDSLYDAYAGMSKEARKQILDDAISDTAKYLEIRSRGISTDQYLDVVTDIKALKPEPTFTNIRDIQTREAIAHNNSLSDKEKDYVMKAYMTDYDPTAKSPQTTELKYDEIRKLGVSPEGYTAAYRDYLDASGTGKRRRTIAYYVKTYGWDRSTAQKVYDLYAGYWKPWKE